MGSSSHASICARFFCIRTVALTVENSPHRQQTLKCKQPKTMGVSACCMEREKDGVAPVAAYDVKDCVAAALSTQTKSNGIQKEFIECEPSISMLGT